MHQDGARRRRGGEGCDIRPLRSSGRRLSQGQGGHDPGIHRDQRTWPVRRDPGLHEEGRRPHPLHQGIGGEGVRPRIRGEEPHSRPGSVHRGGERGRHPESRSIMAGHQGFRDGRRVRGEDPRREAHGREGRARIQAGGVRIHIQGGCQDGRGETRTGASGIGGARRKEETDPHRDRNGAGGPHTEGRGQTERSRPGDRSQTHAGVRGRLRQGDPDGVPCGRHRRVPRRPSRVQRRGMPDVGRHRILQRNQADPLQD